MWSLVRATESGAEALQTTRELAAWLSHAPITLFQADPCGAAGGSAHAHADLTETFAEPAGMSLAVAELARQLCAGKNADAEQAFLLGLVNLGVSWLSESAVGDAGPRLAQLLPPWLNAAVLAMSENSPPESPAAACVADAIAAVNSQDESHWQKLGLDAQHWTAREAKLADAWSQSGPWAGRFPAVVGRLVRLQTLEAEFAAALESAKLEALKEFAYGAGHEINNPLANISARAQTLLQDERDPERRRMLAAINSQAFRAHEMIADTMLFARPPQPKKEPCDLVALVRTVEGELAASAAEQQSELELQLPPGRLEITADPTQIAVALRSLCTNALEALVRGGRVTIGLSAPDERSARIVVADTGPGIPSEGASASLIPITAAERPAVG